MQAKEFLLKVQSAEQELRLLEAKKRHYEDFATSIGSGIGSAVGSKPSGASRVEAAAVGLTDLLTEIDVKIAEYVKLIRKAEKLIEKLPQAKHRQVLTLKYLSGWSWPRIRDEMGYKDPKSVFRVHGYALLELQKVM